MDRFRMLPSYHYEDNIDGNLLKSVGKPLRDYKIEGNCLQDGVPSPDNPIEVQCCGEKTVNLIDFAGFFNKTLPYTRNYGWGTIAVYGDDGTVTLNCSSVTTSHDANDILLFESKYMEPGTYTISGIPYGEDDSGKRRFNLFGQYYENGAATAKYLNNISVGKGGVTFIIKENQGVHFTLRVARTFTADNMVFKPLLQKGDTVTEFEPFGYKVPVTVSSDNGEKTYNIYLDEPLRKVGDYADYVDFKNGKVVRNVANVSLNGSTYILQRKDNETDFYYCLIANPKPIAPRVYCLCNAFNKTYISGVNTNIGIDPYSNGVIRMRPDLSVYDTLEKWQEYTNNNELYVIYPVEALEQPITLPQILTEKHTNIISVGTTLQPSKVNYQYYKGGK